MNSAQKSQARGSTQKFTEIEDIKENVVLLLGGYACLIIEVQAINFDLLSPDEKMVKISSYASLLNSLSFSIQILVRNKKIDVSSYIKLLDSEVAKTKNEGISSLIKNYQDYIKNLTKINTVLDKKFYIIIPFSRFELGAQNVIKKGDFFTEAKTALHTKSETLLSQLNRLSLKTKILEKEELIKFFYDIYNQESEGNQIDDTAKAPVVRGNL